MYLKKSSTAKAQSSKFNSQSSSEFLNFLYQKKLVVLLSCSLVVFFLIFATMRILVVFILLAFGLQGQQTTVNGQQTLCTVPEPVEGTTLGASTSSATAYPRTVDYYESQIRKADSLYKNYLPQYNFEEVKAAVEFFDSYQLTLSKIWFINGTSTAILSIEII